jgi:tyrosine-specific transport protein
MAGSGEVLSSALHHFSIKLSPHFVSFICMLFVGIVIFNGTSSVDFFNRIFMIGLILTYLGLVFLGLKKIHLQNLTHFNLEYSFFSFPILIASFSYHNIIPSLVSYMYHDLRKVRLSIIGGTTITLIIYILWQLVALGILSFENLFSSYAQGIESSQILVKFLKSTWTAFFIQWFAFFAIITSFLIQSTGLMHFIADGLRVYPSKKTNWWLLILTLFPPLIFSMKIPHVFFRALNFAGGFCAILLFCLIPAFMVWKGRYEKKEHSPYQLPGGKTVLLLIIGFSFFILFQELFRIFGL